LGRHLKAWRDRLPAARFINEYGPTETVVGCCVHDLAPQDATPPGRVPIGRPIANTRLFVLDDEHLPVPVGVPGELWVGGAGVGLGYVNRPSLSDEKFPKATFPEAEGDRLYRTGDLVRHLDDGTLEYLGRIDDQINLNGFRIEPGEVESALAEHPDVAECVVVTREGGVGGRARLVAYFTRHPEAETSEKELLRWLRLRLPEYMVPTILVTLQGLPLTANGKVDRAALPAPTQTQAVVDYVPPSSDAEKVLAGIWQEVLGADRVGIHDNFFDLGGDSILSIQVVARAARQGLVLSPRLLFQHQTIADLAALAQQPAATGREGRRTSVPVPLTPIQRWFFDRRLVDAHHYNQAVLLETPPGTNSAWLQAAFRAVVAHHSVFRHRFTHDGANWLQQLADEEPEVPFQTLDLSQLDLSSRAKEITAQVSRLQSSLDLGRGPLVRGLFMACGEDNGRLALIAHHLAVDGVSWRILLDDLEHCYGQISQGREPELPAASSSFARWADELVTAATGESWARDLERWQGIVGSTSGCLPLDHSGDDAANTVDSADVVEVELTASETDRLLDSAPQHHGATVNELLLAALARTLATWCDSTHLLIDLEGHGREPLDRMPDVSRTVGWFTALFPLRLPLDRHGEAATRIGAVTRCLKEIPSKGMTYGVLRYLRPRGELLEPNEGQGPQLSWNYLGRWHAAGGSSLLQGVAAEPVGQLASPRQLRSHLLEVQAVVVDDRLRVEWGFSTAFHKRSTIVGLAERYRDALGALLNIDAPTDGQGPGALAGLDEDQLERLSSIMNQVDEGHDGGPA
ncbi:MAG: AMP-binding protein, partial [Deltaproteobacteria bacterium]|nr:AMP-binding protein [Deltaproteobacteria bacterium]